MVTVDDTDDDAVLDNDEVAVLVSVVVVVSVVVADVVSEVVYVEVGEVVPDRDKVEDQVVVRVDVGDAVPVEVNVLVTDADLELVIVDVGEEVAVVVKVLSWQVRNVLADCVTARLRASVDILQPVFARMKPPYMHVSVPSVPPIGPVSSLINFSFKSLMVDVHVLRSFSFKTVWVPMLPHRIVPRFFVHTCSMLLRISACSSQSFVASTAKNTSLLNVVHTSRPNAAVVPVVVIVDDGVDVTDDDSDEEADVVAVLVCVEMSQLNSLPAACSVIAAFNALIIVLLLFAVMARWCLAVSACVRLQANTVDPEPAISYSSSTCCRDAAAVVHCDPIVSVLLESQAKAKLASLFNFSAQSLAKSAKTVACRLHSASEIAARAWIISDVDPAPSVTCFAVSRA